MSITSYTMNGSSISQFVSLTHLIMYFQYTSVSSLMSLVNIHVYQSLSYAQSTAMFESTIHGWASMGTPLN